MCTAIDVGSQCNWRRSCDWKQRHAIHLLLDTDNYGDTWYALQFVEHNLRELEIKSRGNGRMCPETNPVSDSERAKERERDKEEKRVEEHRDVHIDALAQKAAAHVRLSVSWVLINPICCRFHRLSAFATLKRSRGSRYLRAANSPDSSSSFLYFDPALLPSFGLVYSFSSSSRCVPRSSGDSETLGLIKCKMLPANNA